MSPKNKINLGCENQILPGFLNFDIRYNLFPGALYWEWNKPIPCENDSSDLVVVQHSLMFCHRDRYDWNLQEIYRVLCSGGKLIVKEEDDRTYQWRKLGTKHKTGHIISSTNQSDILPVLTRNGFKNFVTDSNVLIEKYGYIINRQKKLLKGMLFVVESEK